VADPIQGYFDSTSFTLDVNGFPIWNRAVGSTFMAKFAHTVLGNGAAAVTTGGFQVVKKTGMTVTVKPYFICKDGYMMYQTAETDIEFTSSTSEQVFYIGARLDVANNHFTGDDIDAYTTFVSATDLASCKLTITANAVTITDGMITDLRYDANYCGQIDEYRERSLALIAELEAALEAALAGGIPAHASTHEAGGADELTEIYDTFAKINNGGVFAGGAVTAQGTPDQTVAVSAGSIITPEGKRYAFGASATLAASAADATHPRIDIVYVTSAGVVTYLAGTAAASPAQPSTPANGTILAAVARAANDNTIATADITDQRDFITVASDFEDVNAVTENSNAFACDFAKKHTKNFSFPITNTTAKTVTFTNVPYGTCDSILTIKATGTAAVTWTLDGRTLVWPAGAPTLTSGYTYDILFSYVPILGKWVGRAQRGAAN
jgi:hypothetical protein